MNINIISIMAGLGLMILGLAGISEAQSENQPQMLNAKQQAIIPIAAFTAKGDLKKLTVALNEGLEAGLNINEIKEVLVQMYAYAGFPRSLDGLNTFIAVLDERAKKGLKDEIGKEANPLPNNKSRLELGSEIQTGLIGRPAAGRVYEFAPIIDQFLKEHLFADIFLRDVLDFQSRELATVAALASLPAENQLRGHLNVSLNVGLTEAQMKHLISILADKVGPEEAKLTAKLLAQVLEKRKSSE